MRKSIIAIIATIAILVAIAGTFIGSAILTSNYIMTHARISVDGDQAIVTVFDNDYVYDLD